MTTTPALENTLFGGFDCVFASVGPPDGSPRYGEAIIRLRDSVARLGGALRRVAFHTQSATRTLRDAGPGIGQIAAHRGADPLSLGFDDRLHFSRYVVAERLEQAAYRRCSSAEPGQVGGDDRFAGDSRRCPVTRRSSGAHSR
jgi:hypothetical protein